MKLVSSESVNAENNLLTQEVRETFRKVLKIGIYKELHSRSLLSDMQLLELIDKK